MLRLAFPPWRGVKSVNSVRRQKSKDTKSKDRVLKNNNDKRPSAHVQKMSSSVSIESNKHETMHSNVCQSNASVLSTKTVNAVNDGLNIVCVSCGKDVFLLSHEKCVARYDLSRNSSVKRSLFTTPIATKSKYLGATSVVVKSRLSVAKTPTATNKVSNVLPLSLDSSQSRTLSNYMKNKIATSKKWQKWFENQQCFNWTPKSKTAQSLPSEIKSRIHVRSTSNTPVITQNWVAKLSTLLSAFVSCDAGDPARPLDSLLRPTSLPEYPTRDFTMSTSSLQAEKTVYTTGVGEEEVVVREGVVVTSSSLEMLTNSYLGGIMVSLIFLEGLEEEALVEFMVELCEEDEDGRKNEKDGLFNLKSNDQSRKA
ncbi:hypothetical protein Tco_0371403 [Tanacetum coccineum]